MYARPRLSLFVLFLFASAAHAQESVRDLGGPGHYTAFLTPGQLDRWVFDGEKGETIIAYVDRKSTRLNSSHRSLSRMPSSA